MTSPSTAVDPDGTDGTAGRTDAELDQLLDPLSSIGG